MSQSALLKDRRFYPLFWTQFFGSFNDNFLKNAFIILITFKVSAVMGIPTAQMVAAAGGIFILPYFMFSATAGQLADKHEKGSIIRVIKLVEIGIMVLASAGFILEKYSFLLLVLFLMGLHSTFFGPVKYSILPQHLREDELVGGNALIEAGTFLAILLGTIAGGVLVSVPGAGVTLVCAGLVAVAIAGYLASRRIPRAKPVDPTLRVQWNPVPPTLDIFRFIRKDATILNSVLGISWFWFFGAAVLSLLPSYAKDVIGAKQGVVTLFLSAFSVGIAFGSLLCERLSRERLELGLVPLGSIGITLFAFGIFAFGDIHPGNGEMGALDFILVPAGLLVFADFLLLSVFCGLYIVPLYTLIQERSEPSHRSRVIAANNVLNSLIMVVASVMLMALLRAKLTIPQIFLVLAVMNGLVAAYIYTLLPEFLLRFLMWILANILYRLRIENLKAIPSEGAVLLVCNHVSFVDWMIVSAAVKRPTRFVMDFNYIHGSLLKKLLASAKVIPIATAKENPEVLESAFKRIAEELRAGEIVCIFPEGRLTGDGSLGVFKPGVERILAETQVTVVPIALLGLWGSIFSRKDGSALKKLPRRFWSRVTLKVGEPVAPAGATADGLRERVSRLLEDHTEK